MILLLRLDFQGLVGYRFSMTK